MRRLQRAFLRVPWKKLGINKHKVCSVVNDKMRLFRVHVIVFPFPQATLGSVATLGRTQRAMGWITLTISDGSNFWQWLKQPPKKLASSESQGRAPDVKVLFLGVQHACVCFSVCGFVSFLSWALGLCISFAAFGPVCVCVSRVKFQDLAMIRSQMSALRTKKVVKKHRRKTQDLYVGDLAIRRWHNMNFVMYTVYCILYIVYRILFEYATCYMIWYRRVMSNKAWSCAVSDQCQWW